MDSDWAMQMLHGSRLDSMASAGVLSVQARLSACRGCHARCMAHKQLQAGPYGKTVPSIQTQCLTRAPIRTAVPAASQMMAELCVCRPAHPHPGRQISLGDEGSHPEHTGPFDRQGRGCTQALRAPASDDLSEVPGRPGMCPMSVVPNYAFLACSYLLWAWTSDVLGCLQNF